MMDDPTARLAALWCGMRAVHGSAGAGRPQRDAT